MPVSLPETLLYEENKVLMNSSIQANERLSQANLDAIAFPTLLQTATPRTVSPEAQVHPEVRRNPTEHLQQAMAQCQNQGLQTRTRQGSSDTSTSEETLKHFLREKEGPSPEASAITPKTNPPPVLPKTSPPPPPFKTSHRPHTLLSLRISESTLQETSPLQVAPHLAPPTISLHDYDEVFLQEPPPPSPIPPPLPIRETDITEDFPPPPPPLLPPSSLPDREEEENHHGPGLQHLNSCEFPSLPSSYRQTVPPSIPLSVSPRPSLTPETPTTLSSSFPEPQQGPSGEESLGQEYHLSARRERSAGELRVEALARQLVSRGDKTLSPMLDSWAEGGRTMDLMERIFPAGGGRLLWQRRRSSLED
ncbi:protein Shroom3-like, partial [Salvelinus sp. IW2-2015]|uniref:protein Shroom3-like n=1 Tax=Salvelinus sp. IW2-2015 TaxID=2691554 RepID=UPI0038D4D5F5